jgi:hypothetical protein
MSEAVHLHGMIERRHLYAVTALIQAENPPRTIWQTCLIREPNREAARNYGRASLIAGLKSAHRLKPVQITYQHVTVVPCEARHMVRLEASDEQPIVEELT